MTYDLTQYFQPDAEWSEFCTDVDEFMGNLMFAHNQGLHYEFLWSVLGFLSQERSLSESSILAMQECNL
jgi:hypothetical protein